MRHRIPSSVTVLTHLARTQSSLDFYLQECGLFLIFFLLAFFFPALVSLEADRGIHGQDEEGDLLELWRGKMRSSEGLDSPN